MSTETEQNMQQVAFLSGWKDIANYLGKGIRTVQRYERELGLPVRRPAGKESGSVIATKAELAGWVAACPFRAFPLPQSVLDSSAILKEFRCNVEQMRRLREEGAKTRAALQQSLDVLRANLEIFQPEINREGVGLGRPTFFQSNSLGGSADVLPFYPEKNKRIA